MSVALASTTTSLNLMLTEFTPIIYFGFLNIDMRISFKFVLNQSLFGKNPNRFLMLLKNGFNDFYKMCVKGRPCEAYNPFPRNNRIQNTVFCKLLVVVFQLI